MNCAECEKPIPKGVGVRRGSNVALCSSDCRRDYRKKYYRLWFEANRERELKLQSERIKAYHKEHPEYFREYYDKNKARRKQESIEWYNANTERAAQRQREYVAAHPEQRRATGRRSASKRRAIKAKVFVESVDPKVVFERDRGACGICHKPVEPTSNWEIDHVIPISKGGAHGYDNVQLSHRRCNRSKADKLSHSFRCPSDASSVGRQKVIPLRE